MWIGENVTVKDSAGKEWSGKLQEIRIDREPIGAPGEQIGGPAYATVMVVIEDAELTRR